MVIISRAFWYFDQNVYYLHIYIEKCVCSVYNIIKGGKYETKRSCEKNSKMPDFTLSDMEETMMFIKEGMMRK